MGNYNRDDRDNRSRGGRRSFGGGGGGYGGGSGGYGGRSEGRREEREMHKATCDECGRGCEVPFKPTSGKPIFCSDCFKNNDKQDSRREGGRDERRSGGGRDFFEEKQMYQAVCDKCGEGCEVPFRPTGDKPVYCSHCFRKNDKAGAGDRAGAGSRDKKPEQYKEQFEMLNSKLDKILKALGQAAPTKATPVKDVPKTIKEEKPTKEVKKEMKKEVKVELPATKKVAKKAIKKKKKEDKK